VAQKLDPTITNTDTEGSSEQCELRGPQWGSFVVCKDFIAFIGDERVALREPPENRSPLRALKFAQSLLKFAFRELVQLVII
jgi:hypothetical protein